MKAYLVGGPRDECFSGTLKEAHTAGKDYAREGDWRDVAIEEVEVQTDKEGVIAMLNGKPIYKKTGRRWELTPRLGLDETTGDE